MSRIHSAGARRRSRRIGVAAAVLAALAATFVGPAGTALAVDENGYPTWEEVEAARNDVSSQQAQISEIEDLLAQLESDLAAAQEESNLRLQESQAAQEAFDEAAYVADQLQTQADEALASAGESELAASQLAAELARTGGAGDMSAELFANPGSADEWLYRLGLLDSTASTADSLYEQAQQDANTAQSLQDQAAVAAEERERLRDEAEAAYQAAVEAQASAQAALDESNDHRVELETQLEVLVEDRAATEDDYQAGQEWYAEQERLRIERERAAAAAAAAAAAEAAAQQAAAQEQGQNAGGSSSNGGGGYVGPGTSSSGWTAPHYGYISSTYGWRVDPVTGSFSKLHAGLDIVAGCGAPVYAAASGTVAISGTDASGALMVYIDHGSGVQTRYYHMSSIIVGYGQSVSAGQVIAYEGTTGWSTGCHLHFEVRVNGTAVNPQTFLSARGVAI